MPKYSLTINKKSQSALEYLLTYGWAITIIVLVMAAIYYMGILNIPPSGPAISGFSGIEVTAVQANTSVFEFSIKNNLGITANLSTLSVSFDGNMYKLWQCTATILDPGESAICAILGNFSASRISAQVSMAYSVSNILGGVSNGTISITPQVQFISSPFSPYSVRIAVYNNQSSATPTPFQQAIKFNPTLFSGYELSNLGNIRLYYNGQELYSWCEYGCSNNANSSLIWVKLTNSIAANSTINLTMTFEPLTNYNSVYSGEAPQLSPVYGEYDNGANVFNFYDNFKGTTLDTSKWSGGSCQVISNGLLIPSSCGTQLNSNTEFSNPLILEADMNFVDVFNNVGGIDGIGIFNASNGAGTYYIGWYRYSGGFFSGGEWNPSQSWPQFPVSPLTNHFYVWSIYWQPSYSSVMYLNYTDSVSPTTYPGDYPIKIGINAQGAAEYLMNWIRVRSYPPNGKMPSTSISSIGNQPIYTRAITFYNGQNIATSNPFQQMFTTDSAVYSAYEAPNLDNIQFVYQNGSIIPSWLESGNSSKSTETTYWLKIGSIPADAGVTIYEVFYSIADNVFNNINTGEAPQFSPVFGEYNNIANVMDQGLAYQVYYDSGGTCDSTNYQTQLYNSSLGNGTTVLGCASFVSNTAPFSAISPGTSQNVDGTTEPNVVINYQSGYSGGAPYPNPPIANTANSWLVKAIGWVNIASSSTSTFSEIADDGITLSYSKNGGSSSGINWLGGSSSPNNLISQWHTTGAAAYTSSSISAGTYRIELDYFEDGGGSYTGLWSSASVDYYHAAYPPDGVMPTVIAGTNIPLHTQPITFYNGQNIATSNPFQQMFTTDSAVYSAYEAPNLDNIQFIYQNGSIIPSWLESGASNTATSTIYWLKIGSIPANGKLTIYEVFYPTSINMFNTVNTGEAPQLSPIYAEYDDGANVFNNYWNFAGTTLPNGWTSSIGSSSGSVTVNNGVTLASGTGGNNGWGTINYPFTMPASDQTIVEVYGKTASTGRQRMYLTDTATSIFGGYYSDLGFDYGIYGSSEITSGDLQYYWNGYNSPSNSAFAINIPYIIQYILSGSTFYWNILNQTESTVASQSTTQPSSTTVLSLIDDDDSGVTQSTYYWIRMRAYPPNGLMPGTTITVFTESGLPSGYKWNVTYNSVLQSSTTSSITFLNTQGTYSYTVPTLSNSSAGCTTTYTPSSSSGTLLAGSTQSISFSGSTTCTTVFTESGLPSGYKWNVTYNSVLKSSTSSTITYSTTYTGTQPSYSYTVPTLSNSSAGCTTTYTPSSSPSSPVAVGSLVSVTFTPLTTCTTTFTESGLPGGYTWSVDYGGTTYSASSGSQIQFTTAPGTYSFSVSPVDESPLTSCAATIVEYYVYSPSPSSGSLVAGSPQSITYSLVCP